APDHRHAAVACLSCSVHHGLSVRPVSVADDGPCVPGGHGPAVRKRGGGGMMASLIGFAAMVLMMAAGIPIAVCMGAVGVVGFGLLVGWAPALAMTGQIVVDNMLNYSFSLLPLFILMGNLIARSRLSQDLYSAAYAFLGHYRGGLA